MSYIPFPVNEILTGLVQLLRSNRTAFSPNLDSADLDEFFGVGKDLDDLGDAFVIVRTDDGEFGYGGVKSSEDTIKAAAILYSLMDTANSRDGSLLLLRQLVQVLRSTTSLDTLATLVNAETEIKSMRPVSYSPDNQFAAQNYTGWAVNVEIAISSRATKAALPTYA